MNLHRDIEFTGSGHIFVIGGRNDLGQSSADVSCFIPTSGHQTNMPPMMNRRFGHSIAAAGRYIYVFGGFDSVTSTYLSSCERFNFLLRELAL